MSGNGNERRNTPVLSFFADLLMSFLRGLLSSVGFLLAGSVVGAILGGVCAVVYGFAFTSALIIGAIAGFLLALIALVLVHGGFDW